MAFPYSSRRRKPAGKLLLGHNQSLPRGLTLFPTVQLGHGVGGGSMDPTVEQFMISAHHKAAVIAV